MQCEKQRRTDNRPAFVLSFGDQEEMEWLKGYNVGFYIRKKREEKKINQAQLCYGICDRTTLSRIECGKQEPSVSVLKMLIQRLNIDEDQMMLLLGPKDFEISNLQKEIVSYNAQRQYKQAKEKLSQLEKMVSSEDKVLQQFILRTKSVLCENNYLQKRILLTKALALTQPGLDLQHINKFLLGIEEIKILNQLAITYSETGDRRFALRIYSQLFDYINERPVNTEVAASLMTLLCYNYSRLLGKERRYEECIEIAQLGYDIGVKYNKCQEFGGLLLNMAYSLHELGRDTESKEKLIDSYYAYRLMKDDRSCSVVLQYAKEAFGESLF